MKNRPLVSRMSPRVSGRTPLCRARMMRPSQQKRFFPGRTSHLLLGLLGSSLPSGGAAMAMLEFGSIPVRTSGASDQHLGAPRQGADVAIRRRKDADLFPASCQSTFQKLDY